MNIARTESPSAADTGEPPDVHSSSDEYARRFSGDVGCWMLGVQEKFLLKSIPNDAITVLDVGGGHGQTAIPLMKAHRTVTVLGSAPVCAERLSEQIATGRISFQVGNLLELPFPDRSFDAVVCFRILSHTPRWKELIRELCRVARNTVIVDYPVWTSVNILTPAAFPLKHRLEGNTRSFILFRNGQIAAEFRKQGYYTASRYKQYLLPMALHRSSLGKSKFLRKLEGLARSIGLTRLFGSPVVGSFQRKSSIGRGQTQ